jgi:prepilin-type N-terminal cleavage/methylation domain-containing protein
MPPAPVSSRSVQRGFTYVEILLSVVLLAVLLVPALESLQTAVTAGQGANVLARELALRDMMERVLARQFTQLNAETFASGNTTTSVSVLLSDPVGDPNRRNVVVYRYDGEKGERSDADTGLVRVLVYYESEGPARALSTLASRW